MNKQMTSKERFQTFLSGNETDRLPVINPVSLATVDSCKLTGINFRDVHLNADKMATLAAVGYEEIGFDCVMPYFSVVQEAAALGAVIDWGSDDKMPTQKAPLFDDPDKFKMPEDFLDALPIKTVIDSIKLLRKKLGNDAVILGKVMGPWTLSYHLRGLEDFLIETLTDPDIARAFLNKFKEISITFATAQFEAGADAVTVADHATADLVSPLAYKELLMPVHKEINRIFKDRTLILHCCGNTLDRIPYFDEAGFPIFHFDSKNDIEQALKATKNTKLTGCVNNPTVLLNGSTIDVRNQVEEIISKGVKMISPECAIPMWVKNENLKEIVRTVSEKAAK